MENPITREGHFADTATLSGTLVLVALVILVALNRGLRGVSVSVS